MQAALDWVNQNQAVIMIALAAATLIATVLGLRYPAVRRRLGLKIHRSDRVDVAATDKSETDIRIGRSKDVKVRIGGDRETDA
ncbi:hypothetical protein [Rhodovulum sp. P5]|uniref:hypothetical protein n=1 Tax=Rhodovulum sp. P5 TaxID=1564506 RepID=UPI0009DB1719|nr:hypothetical protein [Rhodovulum sp. P5]